MGWGVDVLKVRAMGTKPTRRVAVWVRSWKGIVVFVLRFGCLMMVDGQYEIGQGG